MLISQACITIYPEIFIKTDVKREETMSSFTTSTGIKVIADTVGTTQRGAIQEESRPDFILFEDFETRTTLRSAKKTKAIWDNMEEARTGLAKGGGCIYNCNYLSELGNVHKLVKRKSHNHLVSIISILNKDGTSAWPSRFTIGDIEQMRHDDDDFEGERLCKPSASKDILFDRDSLDKQTPITPIKIVGDFKIFKRYDPSHRYGSGHDVAGGVGLDSSTSVFIDFDTIPAQVVATYKNNLIKPDNFGDEISRETNIYGGCLSAIEKNNHGHATIARARQLEVELYTTEAKQTSLDQTPRKEYGWHTNALTKPKMVFAFCKAVEDGLIDLNDPDLIEEAKAFTRNDLMDKPIDARMVSNPTRHFDLLMGACIAWQMKEHAFMSDRKVVNNGKVSEFGPDPYDLPVDNNQNPFHYED